MWQASYFCMHFCQKKKKIPLLHYITFFIHELSHLMFNILMVCARENKDILGSKTQNEYTILFISALAFCM